MVKNVNSPEWDFVIFWGSWTRIMSTSGIATIDPKTQGAEVDKLYSCLNLQITFSERSFWNKLRM
jgi:hypothetical protein